ncbi:putative E3 ubiquitin ligase containing RING finger [Trachipleistophora hominis]|uniref:RNA polymerase II transcription factor B subunit 3 n=1 Tax=Trachipleistophora hominis TaxID=72359 RepID=L7JSZ3_TRAHO|nr:putative E3 ubiquitin ligase containing RING finger [Trachipleistophora hominis]
MYPSMDQFCPQCKSDSYLNPNIKIYVSPCYHKMCENCVSRIFSQGESACPECGTLLRRINFISQTFEDIDVERECRIRKMLNRVFNKEEIDFDNEEEYDDYLEKYEDLILELMQLKNDMQISKRIESLKDDTGVHKNEIVAKRRRIQEGMDKSVGVVDNLRAPYDPLEDVEKPTVILKKAIELPEGYTYECTPAGYSKRITGYRAVYSLFDDNI